MSEGCDDIAVLVAVLELAGAQARLIEHRAQADQVGYVVHVVEMSFLDDAGVDAGIAFVKALRGHRFTVAGAMVASAELSHSRYSPGPRKEMFVAVQLLVLGLCAVADDVALAA